MSGFTWSFYGFFLAAAVWMAAYFVWAWRAATRDAGERRDH